MLKSGYVSSSQRDTYMVTTYVRLAINTRVFVSFARVWHVGSDMMLWSCLWDIISDKLYIYVRYMGESRVRGGATT